MKHVKKTALTLTLALLLLLTACGSGRGNPEATSFQPDFTEAEYSSDSMVAAADGYYVRLGTHVLYVDKETLANTVFCADPACDHKYKQNSRDRRMDSICLAQWMGNFGLQYYNGEILFKQWNIEWEVNRLYSVGNPTPDELYGVKTDGTGLHILQDLWTIESDPWPDQDVGSNFDYPFAILGDTVMFSPRSHMICVGKLGGDIEDATVLFSYDTGNPTISDGMAVNISAHWMIWVDGGYFYYCGVNFPDAVRQGFPSFLVYRYDPATEINELVWRADEMTDTYTLNGFYIKDGMFYYHITEHDLEHNETGVWRCDLATGETVKLSGAGGADYAEFDSDYIYLLGYYAKTITVLDRETGQTVAELDLAEAFETDGREMENWDGDLWPNYEWLGADDKWLFVECDMKNYNEPDNSVEVLYAIAKDELAENSWREAAVFDRDDYE